MCPMRRRIHVSYEEEDTCVLGLLGALGAKNEEEDTCVL
jgi:hypothetical protein